MKKKAKGKKKDPTKDKRRVPTGILGAMAIVLAGGLALVLVGKPDNQEPSRARVVAPAAPAPSSNRERIPPFHENAEEAKPFPKTLSPSLFPNPVVARAYRIAGEIPEVIAQQPCYCYCDGYGHGSLLDCFKDGHGAGCTVCVKEVLLANQMTQLGKTPAAIRQAIIGGQWRAVDVTSPRR